MRIFYIGNVYFSAEVFKYLLNDDTAELVGLATKSKSNFNSDQFDLSELLESGDIPFKYVKDINAPHIVDWIKSLRPDYIFCFGWSALLKKEVLQITNGNVIGFHPAEIPLNRGRHPLIWALVLGLPHTASTFFRMDITADTGDILSQKRVEIDFKDNAASLYKKVTLTAKEQIKEFLPKLIAGNAQWKRQDFSKGNEWRKRSRNDGLIDFRMSSISIYNLVRSLSKPYPGAEIQIEEKCYQVWKVKINNFAVQNIEPGKVLNFNTEGLEIKTSDGSIILIEHNLPETLKEGDYII